MKKITKAVIPAAGSRHKGFAGVKVGTEGNAQHC